MMMLEESPPSDRSEVREPGQRDSLFLAAWFLGSRCGWNPQHAVDSLQAIRFSQGARVRVLEPGFRVGRLTEASAHDFESPWFLVSEPNDLAAIAEGQEFRLYRVTRRVEVLETVAERVRLLIPDASNHLERVEE